jgi:hypothetical protein
MGQPQISDGTTLWFACSVTVCGGGVLQHVSCSSARAFLSILALATGIKRYDRSAYLRMSFALVAITLALPTEMRHFGVSGHVPAPTCQRGVGRSAARGCCCSDAFQPGRPEWMVRYPLQCEWPRGGFGGRVRRWPERASSRANWTPGGGDCWKTMTHIFGICFK